MDDDKKLVNNLKQGDNHLSDGEDERFFGNQGAGILLISKNTSRILLVLRSEYVNEPGTWGIPGGKIDGSENPKNAAIREAKEEVGFSGPIDLIPGHVFNAGTFKFYNFIGLIEDEFQPKLDWENTDAQWFEINNLPNNLHFGIKSLLSNSKELIQKYTNKNLALENKKQFLKNLINEVIKKEIKKIILEKDEKDEKESVDKIDEPNGGEFGKILFSPDRTDGVDNFETNTPEEQDLMTALYRHYGDNSHRDLVKLFPKIEDQISQGKYKKILSAPKGKVYRILSTIRLADASNLLKIPMEQIEANATNRPWIFKPEKPITLNPQINSDPFQSWTTDIIQLGFGEFKNDTVELIFEASSPNDTAFFFLNPNTAKSLKQTRVYSKENETVSFGPVTIDKVLVYHVQEKLKEPILNDNIIRKILDYYNKQYVQIQNETNNQLFTAITSIPAFGEKCNNIKELTDLLVNLGLNYFDQFENYVLNKYPNDYRPALVNKIRNELSRKLDLIDTQLRKKITNLLSNKTSNMDLVFKVLGEIFPSGYNSEIKNKNFDFIVWNDDIYPSYDSKTDRNEFNFGIKFMPRKPEFIIDNIKNIQIGKLDNSASKQILRFAQRNRF